VLFDTTQSALEAAISGASARQTALASNLANANTPGYQRVDVDFHSSLAAALDGGEGNAAERLHSMTFAPETDASGAVRADGSTVDVDAESAKLAANALEHQAAVQVAHARIGILKAAMGTGY
jgi:flagellar basal-body rod protein FlgB